MSSTQKIIKYCAIAFAISLIVGIFMGIYHGIGFIGGFITDIDVKEGLNIDDYPDSSNILSIDIGAAKVKIVEGSKLEAKSNSKYITSRQDHNKLSVLEKSHRLFRINNDDEVIVYIPKDMEFDKVHISNGAGKVSVDHIKAKDLELILGAGKINIDEIMTFNKTKIEGGAGKVDIQDGELSNLDLSIGVGMFTITSRLKGKADIEAGVGSLDINLLGSESDYKIQAKTGIGSFRVNGDSVDDDMTYGSGPNTIDIDGGVGSIDLNIKND